MPEELIGQKLFGERRAVYGQEPLVGPVAQLMDRPSHQLLARARLPQNQDVTVRRGDLLDHPLKRLHLGAPADKGRFRGPFGNLAPQFLNLPAQEPPFQCVADEMADLIELERLGKVIIGAFLHGLHRRGHAGVSGDDDDLRGRTDFLAAFQDRHASDVFHLEVRQDEIEGLLFHFAQGLLAVFRNNHAMTLLGDHVGQIFPSDPLIVHNEHGGAVMRCAPPPPAP